LSKLPRKHLIAQQIEGPMGGPCDFTAHPDVSVIVTQYAWEGGHEQMGGLMALDYEYDKTSPSTSMRPTITRPGTRATASPIRASKHGSSL
jgi:hypothetical protein